ncbi:hypothetical protein MRX96_031054 [Rhipicephalus microplus]
MAAEADGADAREGAQLQQHFIFSSSKESERERQRGLAPDLWSTWSELALYRSYSCSSTYEEKKRKQQRMLEKTVEACENVCEEKGEE